MSPTDPDPEPLTDPLAMVAQDLRDKLAADQLIAIIRGNNANACVDTASVLAEEGIRLQEVSLTTTDALDVLEHIATNLSSQVSLGAGTALTEADARRAHDAGASFLLTPADAPGLREAARLGLPTIPGALTPSEIYAAASAPGAAAVKLFPADAHTPSYLAALRQPFPTIDILPVGGVQRADVATYLGHGAIAVGVGSPLCGDAPNGGDLNALRRRARDFLTALQEATP